MPSICDMTVNSVCAFRGQVFVGGFVESWYDAGLDCVGWSMIGSATFDLDRSNTSGFMKMPGNGTCEKVLPMSSGVVAYGTNSIAGYYPVTEPAQSFGMIEIYNSLGIAGRDAVAGDGQKHFFVSSKGELFIINAKFEAKKLGYKDFLSPYVNANEYVFLTFNESDQILYISFETAAFCFVNENLHQISNKLTNINPIGTELYASYVDIADAEDPDFIVATDILDFGIAGNKTIMSVELAGSLNDYCYGMIQWRNNKSEDFNSTSWVRFSPGGICHLRVTGRELKILIKGDSRTNVELDYLNIKYLVPDNRNIRGQV